MSTISDFLICLFRGALTGAILLGFSTVGMAQEVPIIQPGAPGESARELSAEEAIDIANTSHSPDDIKFMQDMIPHHNQAVQMSELVADRTNRQEVNDVAGRIDVSQEDEIDFMQGWLRERGVAAPDPTAHDAMHTSHKMAGMASPEQMSELVVERLILVVTDFQQAVFDTKRVEIVLAQLVAPEFGRPTL